MNNVQGFSTAADSLRQTDTCKIRERSPIAYLYRHFNSTLLIPCSNFVSICYVCYGAGAFLATILARYPKEICRLK